MTTLTRRTLLATAAGTTLIAGATACAAAAPVVFNPAVDTWLADIAANIAATVIADGMTKVIDTAWTNWSKSMTETTAATAGLPPYYSTIIYGQPKPPVALVSFSPTKTLKPSTATLAAFVDDGKSVITFQPWAWQLLSIFLNSMTSGKTGEDLAVYQQSAAESVAPCGTAAKSGASPANSVSWMSYEAIRGSVELSRQGKYGQILVNGMPTASGKPMTKRFLLSATA